MRFIASGERKRQGGSDFIELQYCRMPPGTPQAALVSLDAIRHWQEDSLYVQDESAFWAEYGAVFGPGLYANLRSGPMDLYGINYYGPGQAEGILERLHAAKPSGYETLADWLLKGKACSGFYVLGV